MRAGTGGGGRDAPVVWGFVAVFCLGVVLIGFWHTPSAAGRTLFGSAGALAVVVTALVATVVATVVAVASTASRGLRGVVALLVGVIWAAVCVLAGGSLFVAHAPNFLTGLLLAGGAVGMGGLLTALTRRRSRSANGSGR
jgi:hypothetical protein